MNGFAQRLLWLRAREYVRRYQPAVVGVAGTRGTALTVAALQTLLTDTRHARVSAPGMATTRTGVALAVLGATSIKQKASWMRLLIGSRVKEFAEEEPSVIVLELADTKPGEIDFYARTLPLTVTVVTGIESINLDLYQSKELIAHEHTSLVAALPTKSTACLNLDDPLVAAMAAKTKAKVITYGHAKDATVRVVRARRHDNHGFACEFLVRGAPVEVHLPHLIASQHVMSVAAALAANLALGGNTKQVARLAQLKPPRGNLELLAGRRASQVLDGTGVATPEGVLAALNLLADIPTRRRIAVITSIEHLGVEALNWHDIIGRHAAEVADIVIGVGEEMRHAITAAHAAGATDPHHFASYKEVESWLEHYLREGDLVLLAGESRAARQVAQRLTATSS